MAKLELINAEVKAESHRNRELFDNLNSSIRTEVAEAIQRLDEYHREEILKLDRSDQAIKQLETLDAVVKRLTSNMD